MNIRTTLHKSLTLSVVLLCCIACKSASESFQATTTPPPSSVPPTESLVPVTVTTSPPPKSLPTDKPIHPPPPADGFSAPSFADYTAIQVSYPSSFAGGYSLPLDLDAVQGIETSQISPEQEKLLAQNGFVVAAPIPGEYREFYQIYESLRYEIDQPVFVTTDAVFHIYHLIFDKMLRDLEREYFIPTLETLTQTMLATTMEQYQALRGTPLEEHSRRNLAFFAVAAQLLSLPDPVPTDVQDLVEAELSAIKTHAGVGISPIWDRPDLPQEKKLIEDYSQYIPRGHYTRSEALKRYFQAMMWYGRLTYRLRDPFETRRALLIVQALRTATTPDGIPANQAWEQIFAPTAFIVGKSDDLSYHEYGALSDTIFGPGPNPIVFADDSLLDQFSQAARELPPPQINSMWVWIWEDRGEATQGFRFMGQRFTLDAYVFGQMIFRKVGTLENPRDLPKGLDFFAALGSDEALSILDAMGETDYANFNSQMDKVRREISLLEQDTWTQNLYWSWLYAFQPFITPKDHRYPPFMQTQAWTRKDLHTALGSWTELKHDTILYAKQVMAEMGGGELDEPPQGYVEPNPEAYARLLALCRMTYDGLIARNLLDSTTQGNLENLMNLLSFLKTTSERELSGLPLSEDDYWRIQYFGGELEALTLAASDRESELDRDLYDQKAALIADVATGMERVLEEAIGQPTKIFVVLPDDPWRVGIGGVFTHYEFTVSPNDRMTDEEWQSWVESGDTPPPPEWTSLFIAP